MQAPSVVLACRDSTMLTLNHKERIEARPIRMRLADPKTGTGRCQPRVSIRLCEHVSRDGRKAQQTS